MEDLWNEAITAHSKATHGCSGRLLFDTEGVKKIGVCWRERLKCSDCNYVSCIHKLYDEVESPHKRGPNAAAPNLGLQVGLSHTSTSNSGLRHILNAANISAPSTSAMQRHAHRVGEKMVAVNNADMAERCRSIRDRNRVKGLPASAPIRVEGDCRYNNPLYSGSGKTPFQPATQATYKVCENVTQKKQIIAISTLSTLCKGCAVAPPAEGPSRPGEHQGCSATIPQQHSIGDESTWSWECFGQLQKQGVNVKYITTDSDSRAAKSATLMHG